LLRITAILCILTTTASGFPLPLLAGPPSAAKLVDRGIQHYLDGRYDQAVQLLSKALKQKDLDQSRRLGALQYLAFSQVALGEHQAAKEAFIQLLTEQPNFQSPAGTSPKIVEVFEEARKNVAPPPPLVLPSVDHDPPLRNLVGTSVAIEATVDHLPPSHQLVVLYRYDATSKFNIMNMRPGLDGRFTVALPAPIDPKAPAVLYYLELRDGDGAKVAGAGEPKDLFRVPYFLPPKPKEEEGISVHWWIWPVVGAVLLGAGLAVGLSLAGRGGDTGKAIVTVTVVP
jgi:tetratricopeptide (TPR) repeat protein